MLERDLYPPIKRFLEAQGYVVKAEVKSCDVVARRGDEPPVIVELKIGLTLQLIYQAIDRLSLTNDVYIAIARPKRGVPSEALKLLKRIGVGLLVVTSSGSVEAAVHPETRTNHQAEREHACDTEDQSGCDNNIQILQCCMTKSHESIPLLVASLMWHPA